MCQNLFLIKLPASATLLKKRFWQDAFCEFSEISKNTFFYRTPAVAASVGVQTEQERGDSILVGIKGLDMLPLR